MNRLVFSTKLIRNKQLICRKLSAKVVLKDEESNLIEGKSAIAFYAKIFGFSYNKMYGMWAENRFLAEADRKEAIKVAEYLKHLNIPIEDVLQHLKIFQHSQCTVENRSVILKECGFKEVLAMLLEKYLIVVGKKVSILKTHGYIPYDLDVAQHLIENVDKNIVLKENLSDDIPLVKLREHVLSILLKEKLNMSETDIKRLWTTYCRIKHKSFGSIFKVIDILQHEYKFPNDKINKHLYLLYADPENLLKFPKTVPKIAGINIREILGRRPKILMTNCESTKQILEYLKKFNIPETSLLNCLEVLTLGPGTVLERLMELQKIKEFEVLVNHPRIIRLVHYQNKAKIRLDYLQQMKVKCFSLNILSSSSDSFEKYARDGSDRTKGQDLAHYLSKVFKKNQSDCRAALARHPNWCNVPIISVKATLEFLQHKKFKLVDIYENMHIVLYPVNRIEEKLNILIECKESNLIHEDVKIDLTNTTQSQILGLCLYYIEMEFHFTGDGIWSEPLQQIDTSTTQPIEIPKTLSKEYKYGTKPSALKLASQGLLNN